MSFLVKNRFAITGITIASATVLKLTKDDNSHRNIFLKPVSCDNTITKIGVNSTSFLPSDDDAIVANGFHIDSNLTAKNIDKSLKKEFALQPEIAKENYISRDKFVPDQVVVKGGAGWTESPEKVTEMKAPAAVFTTNRLLSPEECDEWIKRAEIVTFDESDFIFRTGKNRYDRMATGGRRHSSTMLVEDPIFAQKMSNIIREQIQVPQTLNDGRKFIGLQNRFLVSRYNESQYFAPHFDGCMTAEDPVTGQLMQSIFTVVLYLSDDFSGGATHYLPGLGSEVGDHVAVQCPKGYGVVHRGVTVMHSAGEVLQGTKYVMQFGLMYEPEVNPQVQPLRWGA
eukprot:gene2080-4061_t